jgi:hypothetical protein
VFVTYPGDNKSDLLGAVILALRVDGGHHFYSQQLIMADKLSTAHNTDFVLPTGIFSYS